MVRRENGREYEREVGGEERPGRWEDRKEIPEDGSQPFP